MRYKSINIEYWTSPDGTDFLGINELSEKVDKNYFLTINKKRTDACGGGLYDLLVKITEDISLLELTKSYIQDGVKILLGYSLITLFKELKILFKSNQHLNPSLDKLVLDYRDCRIIIYSLYELSIEKSIQEILEQLCQFYSRHKSQFKTIKKIHIPIINNRDSYNLCDFRVKLDVDEPVVKFTKDFYFMFWGLSTKKEKYIYDLCTNKVSKRVF